MEVLMIEDGGDGIVRNERGTPDVEKLINESLREVGLEKQKFGQLESGTR
jgi:hypothetical protein